MSRSGRSMGRASLTLEPLPNVLGEPLLTGVSSRGLRVLLDPRPDYVGAFGALGIHFGSIDRVAGRDGRPIPEGLAHFLEHKLFEDQLGDVSDRFSKLGASTNAMTGFSGTTYLFSTAGGTRDELRTCLELLLDFVQTPWFTDALVAKEQGIIAQEIRMYDDDPDWRIFFGLLRCLYGRHPVRDNIAGSVESIATIDAATLRACYDLFYHPRNMCLALSGAFDAELVAEVVARDQEARADDALPRHVRAPVDEPELPVASRHEERLPVSRPRWLLGVKDRVPGGTPLEQAARQLETRILLDALFGRASTAFEQLYAEGLVDESFSASYSGEDGFGFSLIGGDTDDPEQLEDRVRGVIQRARRDGLDAAVLLRVRNRLRGALVRALDSLENAAFGLITEHFQGLPPFSALQLVEQVDAAALQRRLEQHLRDEAFAVAVVRPVDP